MDALIALAVVAACAALNRVAGGGMWVGELWDEHRPNKLPGRALYPATVAIGLVAAIVQPWPVALALAGAFALWRSPAWGHMIGMGRFTPERPMDRFQKTLFHWADGDVRVAFLIRHLVTFLPGALLVGWLSGSPLLFALAVPVSIAFTGAYEIAWRVSRDNPIRLAEWLCGALWGALVLLT